MKLLLILTSILFTVNSYAAKPQCFSKDVAIELIKSNLDSIAKGNYTGDGDTSVYLDDLRSGVDHFDSVLLNPSNISFYGIYRSSYEDINAGVRIDIALDCQGKFSIETGSYNGD